MNEYAIQERLIKLISFFIPLKVERRKFRKFLLGKINYKRNRQVQKYLEQYSPDKKEGAPCADADLRDLPVWLLWFQGEDEAPAIVKRCIESVKRHVSPRTVNILTKDNMGQYLQLPEYIVEKKNNGIISNTHFSDIVRICLLEKYGGTWIDATVLLTDEIPDQILRSDFFAFSVPDASPNHQFHLFSSWFLHAKPDHVFMKAIKEALFGYWKNESSLINYFTLHLIAFNVIKNDDFLARLWRGVPQISNESPHLLQTVLTEKFDESVFDRVKEKSSIHKLTYKIKNQKPGSFFDELIRGNVVDM